MLRANLILEEAKETIEALGFEINLVPVHEIGYGTRKEATLIEKFEPNLKEIADGCADISVVTIGTLIACGIHDAELLKAVDRNNLDKFGPGHSIREDGKLIKPPGHKPPDILQILRNQRYEGE